MALLSIVSTDFSIGAPWSNVEIISKSLYFFSSSFTLSLTAFTTSTVFASAAFTI